MAQSTCCRAVLLPAQSASVAAAVPDVANGTPFFVDTGTITNASLTQTFGTEALWVRGPLSWQSEAMGSFVDTSTSDNAFLNGAYSQVGWFLTGHPTTVKNRQT